MNDTTTAMTEQPAEVTGTQLVTIDPEKYVTAVFATFRDRLEQAKTAAAAVSIDVSTGAGMQVAIKHRAIFRDIRIEAEKARKLRKAPILEIGKLLDTRFKEIEAEVTPEEDRFDKAIKAEEQRKEAEKSAREKAEAERIARIQAEIEEIRNVPVGMMTRPSAEIADTMTVVRALEIDERFAEFAELAELAKVTTIRKLDELHGAAIQHEENQRKVAEQQAELERMRAEEAKRIKEAAEKEAANIRRIADIEAATHREMERKATEQQARLDEENRIAREVRERADAESRAARQAEEARLDAIRKDLERQRREAEEKERAERFAKEEAERKARQIEEDIARAEQLKKERLERERLAAEEAEAKRVADALAEQERVARIEREQREAVELAALETEEMIVRLRERIEGSKQHFMLAKAIDRYLTLMRKVEKAA